MDDGNVAVLAILDNQTSSYKTNNMTLTYHDHVSNPTHPMHQEEVDVSENHKQNVIWSKNATLMLLNLYENKMHMMDNPKKKTKMWTSIADELKSFNIEVTPDQVRWKVNALTKKYKDCVEKCQGPATFKYFNEMHHILGRYSDDNSAYRLASGVTQGHLEGVTEQNATVNIKKFSQKSSMPFRRLRTERKAKIEIDKQWIEYLRRQEEQKQIRNERHERSLRLREEELQLRRKELEIKQSIALKKLQLREKKQEELLRIEREKCDLLRQIMSTK